MKNEIPEQLCIDGSTYEQQLYDEAIFWLKLADPNKPSIDERLREPYYLATSFGKDSIVAQRLCDEAGVQYEAHHNHTTVDPPELVYFGRKYYPDAIRHYPAKNMFQLIEEKGILPLRKIRFCCEALKEDGGNSRTCVMGIRAAESSRRAKTWGMMTERHSTNHHLNRIFEPDDIEDFITHCSMKSAVVVSPLFNWLDNVLWNFIHDRKLPYCELYDQNFSRLGCILCPMAGEKQRRVEKDRWPGYYKLYLRTAQKLIDSGKMANYGNAEAIMEWWLCESTQRKPIDADQLTLDF